MSFDGGDRHPPFIDLDVHVVVQLTVGCVHAIMPNGDADIDIANEHFNLCHLLRHHQVVTLQLSERDLYRLEQWGDHNA